MKVPEAINLELNIATFEGEDPAEAFDKLRVWAAKEFGNFHPVQLIPGKVILLQFFYFKKARDLGG